MMFKRKKSRGILVVIREAIWPSIGWLRSFKYVKHRVARLEDTSSKIAAGLAFGIAVSFSPLMGTHLLQAGLLAYLFRANVVAALIGTIIGNPWTFPVIWIAALELGSFIFQAFGLPASTVLPANIDFEILWEIITHEPARLFFPWLLGGYLLAFAVWPVSYYVLRHIVRGLRAAHIQAKKIREQKRAQKRDNRKENKEVGQ